MAHTQAINEASPAGTDSASGGAAQFRELKRDIRERMAIDHVWSGDLTNDGVHKKVTLSSSTLLTIAAGAITVTQSWHAVENEGGAATDDLVTITAGTGVVTGHRLILMQTNPAHIIVLKTGGNLLIDGDCILNGTSKLIELIYDGTNWREISRGGQGRRPGDIVLTGKSTAPSGWLLCDGSAVSRTTFAGLFAEISTTFGVGDGSTTFNVPDLRGRAPIGAGTGSGLTARTLAGTVGVETHPLVIGELASHDHGGSTGSSGTHNHTTTSDGAHIHTIVLADPGGNPTGHANVAFGATNATDGSDDTSSNGAHTHTISSDGAHTHTISAQGSGTAHQNMQPSLVINFIIKT